MVQPSSKRGRHWAAARAYGCDMALLAEYLNLNPPQRLARHRRALQAVSKLNQACEHSTATRTRRHA